MISRKWQKTQLRPKDDLVGGHLVPRMQNHTNTDKIYPHCSNFHLPLLAHPPPEMFPNKKVVTTQCIIIIHSTAPKTKSSTCGNHRVPSIGVDVVDGGWSSNNKQNSDKCINKTQAGWTCACVERWRRQRSLITENCRYIICILWREWAGATPRCTRNRE